MASPIRQATPSPPPTGLSSSQAAAAAAAGETETKAKWSAARTFADIYASDAAPPNGHTAYAPAERLFQP